MRPSPILRRLLRLMCVVAIVCGSLIAAQLSAAAAPPPSPWLQDGYNAAHSRANTAETIIGQWNAGKLTNRWNGPARQINGCNHSGVDYPVISESRVYSFSGDALTAQSLKDGSSIWRNTAALTGLSPSSLAVTNNRVITGVLDCDTVSEFHVSGYDAATGARVWDKTIAIPVSSADVLVSGGQVIVADDHLNTLSALRPGDGKTLWSVTNSAYCEGLYLSVVGGNIVHSCAQDTKSPFLEARSLSTGVVVWKVASNSGLPVGGDLDSANGKHLYVDHGDYTDSSGEGPIADRDPATGALRFTLVGSHGNPAVDGTRVYASCYRTSNVYDDQLCAYDINTGQLLWHITRPYMQLKSFFYAGGLLFTDTGHVFRAKDGLFMQRLKFSPLFAASGRVAGLSEPNYNGVFGIWAPPSL